MAATTSVVCKLGRPQHVSEFTHRVGYAHAGRLQPRAADPAARDEAADDRVIIEVNDRLPPIVAGDLRAALPVAIAASTARGAVVGPFFSGANPFGNVVSSPIVMAAPFKRSARN